MADWASAVARANKPEKRYGKVRKYRGVPQWFLSPDSMMLSTLLAMGSPERIRER